MGGGASRGPRGYGQDGERRVQDPLAGQQDAGHHRGGHFPAGQKNGAEDTQGQAGAHHRRRRQLRATPEVCPRGQGQDGARHRGCSSIRNGAGAAVIAHRSFPGIIVFYVT